MKRLNKREFDLLCTEAYPKLNKQDAISKIKADYSVVVVNRNSSAKKAYMIKESFLAKMTK